MSDSQKIPDTTTAELDNETVLGVNDASNKSPKISRRDVIQKAIRAVINTLITIMVAVVALLAWDKLSTRRVVTEIGIPDEVTSPAKPNESVPDDYLNDMELGPYDNDTGLASGGIYRFATLNTTIPTRSRVSVITYTVETGDSLFSIADQFGLKPETILWGNFTILEDNPHLLKPEQVLNILPVNGTYYQWAAEDNLARIADEFNADPDEIIEYPGNRFDLAIASLDEISMEEGSWVIIPGGKREFVDWGPPAITRENPASASYYGPGHCGSIYQGAIGVGPLSWPTSSRSISGYYYDPNIHPAIDIGGFIGDGIYASDSGVVVYAGWSNWGYGNLIVIDHGNGWATAYAHLNTVSVGCGQSVFRGAQIAGLGNTGNSSGPHLHFEMVYYGAKQNPLNFLQ